MIPDFEPTGNLPAGIHWADWSEFKQRFGNNPKRLKIIQGIRKVMQELKSAGCRTIYINGSFVTNKPIPGDFDACWDREDVDMDVLKQKAPTLIQIYNPLAQKSVYQGEIYPSDQPVDDDGKMSIDFFQRDRQQNPKVIVAIDLLRWDDD